MEKSFKHLEERGFNLLYPSKTKITVGMATCGRAAGAAEVFNALKNELLQKNLDVELVGTGCLGFCQQEPLVTVFVPGSPRFIYGKMNAQCARELVDFLCKGQIYRNNMLGVENEDNIIALQKKVSLGSVRDKYDLLGELSFFKHQVKIATRNCGYIDPFNIEEYIGRGGYSALLNSLCKAPENVIGIIKLSGLRGRGGAGFSTGIKWEMVYQNKSNLKYVICNADEGDPGAYMDRSILESDPHSVIEGMILGSYAMGAAKGIIYVRAEYPLAVETLEHAIAEAREYKFLGRNIFGLGHDFDLEIVKGAGAFVCGEETALIASIEGHPGTPRPRPPFPAQQGLWGKPTCINNVETWANIPVIMLRGADWYSQFGTDRSKGTKVFSLVGNINNNGLVEVPMGISLRKIIYELGGGIPERRKLKAVQTGGPSGGCVPATHVDLAVDYEKLAEAGTIMGSGGMMVIDECTCVVDLAKFFLTFVRDESCGKCTPCREGTEAVLNLLTDISKGHANINQLIELEELCMAVKEGSLCGLGQTACNPVLSTLRYFRHEYEEHIKHRNCPANVCKELIAYAIEPELCAGCGICKDTCTQNAIWGEISEQHSIDIKLCTKCGACCDSCPNAAIKLTGGGHYAGDNHQWKKDRN